MKLTKLLSSVSAVTLLAVLPAMAQETADASRDNVFALGEITVHGLRDLPISGSTVTQAQMLTFDKISLDQAVNLAPGVNGQLDSNGRRNESDIFVRGFGRWQVPLMIDGVRIYLPADNRLDFARFLTSDVSEIQIQKGYVSVLDGPGGMGGEINLVTRKPTRELEVEAHETMTFDRSAALQGTNGYAMVGTRQSNFYAQGSISYSNRDFWTLSDSYTPTATSLQPKGRRINSDSNDMRINAKVGFVPNDTDEYTINFTHQEGEKGGMLNVYTNPPVPPNSFWRWPQWDIQSITGLSYTQLGAVYLKTKLYYNEYKNTLKAYDDITFTTQSANGRFTSPYSDDAKGVSAELGSTLGQNDLKGAVHFRVDQHDEYNINRPTNATAITTEPVQHQAQRTWSFALEDTFHASSALDLVASLSYDDYTVTDSQDYNTTAGLFSYPKGGATAFNFQGAAIYNYSDTGQVHASISDRARFPIFFELYSTRFGTAVPNPNLGPERALNYEVGVKEVLFGNTRVEGAVFYSDVKDLIQTVQITAGATPQTQAQNVGNGEFYGFELSLDTKLSDQFNIGGNYSYIYRQIKDSLQPLLRLTGVPKNKAFGYITWKPTDVFTLTPSVEIAGDRWSDRTTSPAQAFPYIRVGHYALINLQAEFKPTEHFGLAFGAKNLSDQNYELSWGLPQSGRTYYLRARVAY